MSLRLSYTLLAPFYDLVAARAFDGARRASLAALPRTGVCNVLLDGAGTGLDLPHLPACHRYAALDLTHAMLMRALPRARALDLDCVEGDGMALPFRDASFDYAVLHLILAVVPQPVRLLAEAARVVKRGGSILVMDKFLRPGVRAPLRRLLSPLAGRIATRTDVVFEEVLAQVPGLHLERDEPAMANGWFRQIRLTRS